MFDIFFTPLMPGERIVTTLLPYGPEKPRAGIVKTVLTDAVEISWEPPKGGFTKYVLGVDPQVGFLNIILTSILYCDAYPHRERLDGWIFDNKTTAHW